jgi:hypothetical protein
MNLPQVFLIIRPKEGTNPEVRLQRLLEGPQYMHLKDEIPKLRKKICLVPLDLANAGIDSFPEELLKCAPRSRLLGTGGCNLSCDL